MDGRTLHFQLAGINNQNFIMRDRETGSWWQQVSGRAIFGPLAGKSLKPVVWDEVTFAVFRQEHPGARVLLPAEEYEGAYAGADWEERMARYPVPGEPDPRRLLPPRELVVGVACDDSAKAYRWSDLDPKSPIADTVGDTPILILLHPDGRSLRCFDRRLDGDTLDLYVVPETDPPVLMDGKTRSTWAFSGLAITGPAKDRQLRRVPCLKDYWFDWEGYHPRTRVFHPDRAD